MTSITERKPNPNLRSRSVTDDHTGVTVNTSTAETNLCSLAVPSTVVAGDILRFEIVGNLLNNTGGAVNYTFKMILGATTLISTGATGFSANAARRRWVIRGQVLVVATNDQRSDWMVVVGPQSATLGAGSTSNFTAPGYGTGAEDLTAGKNIICSVTMGTSDANAEVVSHYATLEVLKRT